MSKKIVTEDQVLEMIKDAQITVGRLASFFDCDPATVRARVRSLREDGVAIIHDKNGLMQITKESLESDDEVRKVFNSFMKWTLATFNGAYLCAKPAQPLLPALRRALREELTAEERRELSDGCVRMKMIIDAIEVDME
jgi:DNA-binding Lrp family transcriptional regulator